MEKNVDTATPLEKLYEKAKGYMQTSVSLFALNSVDKTADVISSLISKLLITIAVVMFTLFVSVGLGLLIGDILEASYLGFFIVSGFYFLLACILYIFRRKLIKQPVTNEIISKLLKPSRSGYSILDNLKDDEDEEKE